VQVREIFAGVITDAERAQGTFRKVISDALPSGLLRHKHEITLDEVERIRT
jgi:hypothetical protein